MTTLIQRSKINVPKDQYPESTPPQKAWLRNFSEMPPDLRSDPWPKCHPTRDRIPDWSLYTSITPTALLCFGTPEVHFQWNAAFVFQHCVAEAVALRSLWFIHWIYPTYESNCIWRRLDLNGSRRWMWNFFCIHIQMMLRTIFSVIKAWVTMHVPCA